MYIQVSGSSCMGVFSVYERLYVLRYVLEICSVVLFVYLG